MRFALRPPVKHDPLRAHIAARLTAARFSVFLIERVHEGGGVMARDLLDDRATIYIMDGALAAQVAALGEFPIARRFVDLGPRYIGFGIVVPLRKSAALALALALALARGSRTKRIACKHPSHSTRWSIRRISTTSTTSPL